MYLNKAIIIGNLTRDPELKSLPSGLQVATMGIATNRVWKDKDGSKKEDTQYHNIVVFGRQAETTAQFLRKGSSVLVEGRMQTRSWESPDGKKNYRTEIVADRVQFGPRPGSGAPAVATPVAKTEDQPAPPIDAIDYPEEVINADDIPF
ncbi:MAG: Single-stranded DNA-binding protein [Parcubacteria group bacterium GW2011_GWB1_49_7]|uniref:Single-stranded DNA-binding protein n=1 Tax=Candidatus Zambryskibacteria bacterium RIFCSPHIGHO2_01_FULL_46_25 TaxID=1802738 RepID=A0A1G2T0Q1_9BACT|nr:MAG: Single-stranded DNA-binding protein [Parcubacteria group bacterium GW2011_GWA1_47_10]KKW09633.1 MAG: Single-stranded DNA-binding protein [Parcubacteria group bacterium GW2011_GWB1_49_7]OHA90804.1 MAG: single-stranded DNA-binding protein [Candidatus Zambryskibacteria bacterium RIFCSPHIGHO2_01_FULL_46_25]OHB00795.1 MAG: single-stranded DNA-binding protein [Candidatus Zambryskibacteria bacterium RIFCSPHIGHO2_12_FULL_48_10]OHB07129.1 MAG: single-stranded DNA-binding protein [Candidatus Zamb